MQVSGLWAWLTVEYLNHSFVNRQNVWMNMRENEKHLLLIWQLFLINTEVHFSVRCEDLLPFLLTVWSILMYV